MARAGAVGSSGWGAGLPHRRRTQPTVQSIAHSQRVSAYLSVIFNSFYSVFRRECL